MQDFTSTVVSKTEVQNTVPPTILPTEIQTISSEIPLYPNLGQMLNNTSLTAPIDEKLETLKQKVDPQKNFSAVLKILLNLQVIIDEKLQREIQQYIQQNPTIELEAIFLGLYQQQIIDKFILIKLSTSNPILIPELGNNLQLRSWWEHEKQAVRARYISQDTSFPLQNKQLSQQLKFLLNNKTVTEQQLVTELKAGLTKYARENFYVYKSGNTYYYSPNPNEESIGGRCDVDGNPLKDEYGNNLTDNQGNFRYGKLHIQEKIDGGFEYTSEETFNPKDEPLTDLKGNSLATKYKNFIKKEKPKGTSKARAEAINYIFQRIDTASADEIFRYISTPSFQKLIGNDEIKLSIWRTHLASVCEKFTEEYQQFLQRSGDATLLKILFDEQIYQTLTSENLEFLFWHYNPRLIADIIINLYQDKNFHSNGIDFTFLQNLLNNDSKTIEQINIKRCELRASLLLPMDIRIPGKNTLEDEKLDKFQLFQYDDKTIAAVEQWIRTTYAGLIINNFDAELDEKVPFYFYQIPANSYMLLDPEKPNDPNYHRYTQLKKDLPQLINDSKKSIFKKPIIFFGIINIDNTHYVPYFIYKNQLGKIQVIIVDPSPYVYTENRQDDKHIDTKTETYKKAKRIFQDLLPGCEFFDPWVTQMLRERDCGPNSAQTNTEALAKSTTTAPLIFIDEKDQLRIEPTNLAIQAQPQGINPYTNTFVYSSTIEFQSSQNRSVWAERLSKVEAITYYGRLDKLENQSISVLDPLEQIPEEYSYLTQVKSQTLHDERNTNVSAIQSILLGDEVGRKIVEELIINYKKTLQIVNLQQLANFIKSKTTAIELEQYTSAHEKKIMLLLEDVATVILKDHIPEALETGLYTQVLIQLPNRTDLSATKVVSDFLDTHQKIYRKLAPHEQIYIKEKLNAKAEITVQEKLMALHTATVRDLIKRNCRVYLASLTATSFVSYSLDSCLNIIISHLDDASFFTDKDKKYKPPQITEALNYLKTHDSDSLKEIVRTEIISLNQQVLTATLPYARSVLKFNEKSLQELLPYFDPVEKIFLPPSAEQYLPQQFIPNVLSKTEAGSILGVWIQQQMKQEFFNDINAVFSEKMKAQAIIFMKNPLVIKALTEYNIVDLDRLFDDQGTIQYSLDFSAYINEHGNADSITLNDYNNPIARPFIQHELTQQAAIIIRQARDQYFVETANIILAANAEKLTFKEINEKFNLFEDNANLTHQLFSSTVGTNTTIATLFQKNFLVYDQSLQQTILTQCGIRFHQHFTNIHTKAIKENYLKIKEFSDSLEVVILFLAELESKQNNEVNKILAKYKQEFALIQQKLNALSLYNDCEKNFQLLTQEFGQAFQSVMVDLQKCPGYTIGDTTPGSITTLVRPTLCNLLSIKTNPILTPTQAKDVDKEIKRMLENARLNKSIQKSSLIIMDPVKTLPVTYNQSLTPQLILDLVGFWYTNRATSFFKKDGVTPLIQKLIDLANAHIIGKELVSAEILKLKHLLQLERKEQLQLFTATDVTSQVAAALLKTKEFAGELHPSNLTFNQLIKLLRGEEIKIENKKAVEKPRMSLSEFNNKVMAEFERRGSETSIDQVRKELLQQLSETYMIEGHSEPVLIPISREEFQKKLVEELRKRNKAAIEAANRTNEHLSEDQKSQPKLSNMKEVTEDLSKIYTIQNKKDAEEQDEEKISVDYVSQKDLKRTGFLTTFDYFADTGLDKDLKALKARHTSDDDKLDEYDIEQLRLRVVARGIKLGKEQQLVKHYLTDPNRKDKQYIAMASILAQYYRLQGKVTFMYELLMSGCFPSSKELKSYTLPASILKEMSEISKDDRLYDFENKVTLDIKATVDDIPLPYLIITGSGYALDINWVIRRYVKDRQLVNPYTNKEFSTQDIDDILHHPMASQLFKQIKGNCYVCGITPRAIDLLEAYVIGTVFDRGFSTDYNKEEQEKSELAAQQFHDALKLLPSDEKNALMNEVIPNNQYGDTVKSILNNAKSDCIAYGGIQLARVVKAYKGDKNFPFHIAQRIGEVPSRTYPDLDSLQTIRTDVSLLEKHIITMGNSKVFNYSV